MAGRKDQPGAVPAGPRRSRRALFTGGLAAVLSAGALARPDPAAAANGGSVILGQGNAATNTTGISNSTGGQEVLSLQAVGAGAGLAAASDSGTGVFGASTAGTGVFGDCSSGTGVYGRSGAPASGFPGVAHGVHGLTDSFSGVGVLGGEHRRRHGGGRDQHRR